MSSVPIVFLRSFSSKTDVTGDGVMENASGGLCVKNKKKNVRTGTVTIRRILYTVSTHYAKYNN